MANTMSHREIAATQQQNQNAPLNRERLTGFDVFRGLAAFAVITMHAGMVTNLPLTVGVGRIDAAFGFAVPFFLLASFYFNVRSIKPDQTIGQSIKKRAGRLLLPYLFWTLIYIGLKVGKLVLLHQASRIPGVIADPVAVFLLGASGVHLYFLPLLFVGLVVLLCVATPVRSLTAGALWCLFTVAVLANAWMVWSGNAYNLATNRAFEHLLGAGTSGFWSNVARLGLAFVAHALRCLPLILLAFLLNRQLPLTPRRTPLVIAAVIGGGMLLLPATGWVVPAELSDVVFSAASFLVAWALSFVVPERNFITRMGAYSFGIYLCHQIFLEVLQIALRKYGFHQHTQNLAFSVVVSAAVFTAAWITVALADRCGPFARAAFGIAGRKSIPNS